MSSIPAGSAPPAVRKNGIPRLIYLARILWLCFFPVFTVMVGDVVLIAIGQAREALVAFNDDHAHSQLISFELGYVLWMVSAWYVARLLVGKRFEPDLIGECSSRAFARGLAEWLPRLLAFTAGLPIPLVLLYRMLFYGQSGLGLLVLVLLVSGGIVLAVIVVRRSWGERYHQKWRANWSARGSEEFERFNALSGSAWVFISVLFLVSFGLWLAIPLGLEHVARPLGAPSLLLFALMSWTLFGGFVLTYLPRSYGWPAQTWIPVALLLAFYPWNENHPVAPPSGVRNVEPEDVGDTFKRWLNQRPDPTEPVIFVASAGGASRAAYWTTSALGMLEDEARRADSPDGRPWRFADNVFVISSVSGGSLGAATFLATLDLTRGMEAQASSPCRSVQQTADRFTGQDHLSTVLAFMLFPDLLQRLLPIPVNSWDRSRGLEEVWVSDWDELLRECGAQAARLRNPWKDALTALSARTAASRQLPVLALNATALGAGQQVLEASFYLPRADVFDLLGSELATGSLTLAQAVHNSARFPYVSPGGVVRLKTGRVWDRLGDGGYVEASGALMLGQIMQVLSDEGLIREEGTEDDDTDPWSCRRNLAACYIRRSQIRILILDNTPATGSAYLCGRPGPGRDLPTALVQNLPSEGRAVWPPGADVWAAPLGAFDTRDGRALSAEVDLRGWADGCTAHFAELRLPQPPKHVQPPSMNWMLNRASRDQIDAVLRNPGTGDPGQLLDPHTLLGLNLDIVRAWFSSSSPPPATAEARAR
jgi:hypothetical protein